MKQIVLVLVFILSISYALGLWDKENEFDYNAAVESVREDEDGCLSEEQECTHDKNACCKTGDMDGSNCNCYTRKYFDGKPRPEITKCFCEFKGAWWNFAYNDIQ